MMCMTASVMSVSATPIPLRNAGRAAGIAELDTVDREVVIICGWAACFNGEARDHDWDCWDVGDGAGHVVRVVAWIVVAANAEAALDTRIVIAYCASLDTVHGARAHDLDARAGNEADSDNEETQTRHRRNVVW